MVLCEQELIEKEKTLCQLKARLQEETVYLRQEIKAISNFEEIISHSDVFHQVLHNVEKVADTNSTVLILGETGRPVSEISQNVMDQFMKYDWPGNIRELENIIERAVILCEGERIKPGGWIPTSQSPSDDTVSPLEESKRQHILRALNKTNWRVSGKDGAIRLLDIKRTTLQARMKKLGIQKPQ